jgi:hypothetical protein
MRGVMTRILSALACIPPEAANAWCLPAFGRLSPAINTPLKVTHLKTNLGLWNLIRRKKKAGIGTLQRLGDVGENTQDRRLRIKKNLRYI